MKVSEQIRASMRQADDTPPGHRFQQELSKVDKNMKVTPQIRKKVFAAVWKKYKSIGDGLLLGGKHVIMDAPDGYHRYTMEDMTDAELITFARWKKILLS
jgi:hypothetical protein